MVASEEGGERSGNDAAEGRVIAVYAGKGGVGVSSICVNLASLLATDHKQRVVAVDMDLQYGDLASLINTPDEHPTLADLVAAPVEEIDSDFVATGMIEGPGGFKLIACPPRPELSELVTPAHVTRLLNVLRERFQLIVVDCGHHMGDATTAVTDMADTVLLVTSTITPSLKSLRLAMTLLGELGVGEKRMKVVLNHPDAHSDFSDDDVADNLSHELAASLPHDSRTAVVAADSGEPFVYTRPKAPLAAAMRRLAADIAGDATGVEERKGLMGMLSG